MVDFPGHPNLALIQIQQQRRYLDEALWGTAGSGGQFRQSAGAGRDGRTSLCGARLSRGVACSDPGYGIRERLGRTSLLDTVLTPGQTAPASRPTSA